MNGARSSALALPDPGVARCFRGGNAPRIHSLALVTTAMLALGVGGCASTSVPPAPVWTPQSAAASLEARSLRDDGLRRFVGANLGREPGDTWDFEALNWAAFFYHPSLELARAQWATAQAVARTPANRPTPPLPSPPG